MNSKLKKMLFTSIILFFGMFFANINLAYAEDVCDGTNPNDVCDGDGHGFAKCIYDFESVYEDSGSPTNGDSSYELSDYAKYYRPYRIGMVVYKKNDGHFYGWGDIGCGAWEKETDEYHYSDTVTGTCFIDNYNSNFTNFDGGTWENFVSNGDKDNPKWTCPDKIYIDMDKAANDHLSMHFVKSACTNGVCQYEVLLSNNLSQQNGQPGQLNVSGKKREGKDDGYGRAIDYKNGKSETNSNSKYDITIPSIIAAFADPLKAYKASKGDVDCGLIPDSIMIIVNNAILILQVVGILALVILTIIEFVKVITTAEEDGLKGAIKNTFRRIIMVILLLIVRPIIIWILALINLRSCM